MAIWMGLDGGIRIARTATEQIYANISVADVDAGIKRFGLDKPVSNLFSTGDRVEITRVDAEGKPATANLDFVAADGWPDSAQHPDGTWYVNVDLVGGIRLYDAWSKALANKAAEAVALVPPSSDYRLALRVVQGDDRCLGRTVSWTLNTNRDVADITSLGEGFQKQMATLVSGSGDIDCFFDVLPSVCHGDSGNEELSQYLHRLALRLEIGSVFSGVFLIKQEGCNPIFNDSEAVRQRELFYACDCVITEVGVEVNTEDAIHSQISFVTTGEIKLLYSFPANYLLQEASPDEDKILQESEFGVLLETPE
jgi:hypothetical protein